MARTRKIQLGLLALALTMGLAATACHEDSYIAKGRVKSMLEAWQKGGTGTSGDAQDAITLWAFGGKGGVDGAMSDQFDNWRREKNLYRPILHFEIKKVKVDTSTSPPTAYVTVFIDGATYRMKVIRAHPIQWAD